MDNRLIKVKLSSVITGCFVAAGLCISGTGVYAQDTGAYAQDTPVNPHITGAEFSDRQLSPNSNPSAAVGNDLLLAENAIGGDYPESWTSNLYMSETNPGTGSVSHDLTITNPFHGTGPTGTYAAGTIGDGKHTENTLADIHLYVKPGTGIVVYYQYVVTDTTYDVDGDATVGTFAIAAPQSYPA